ncbi:LADA_0H08328g1_1 [Lachancea dasiensis]|uniref:LADA_0H08328g1_1 n=1 Tax=Lachancea dasiensis TaxID=1072105 RepID=A0A1G4K2D9_9SACH|nr:LADA_0H08328g1_1 [Lachancea dasiensis]
MLKSAHLAYPINCPAKSTMTPIRESGQDFFVKPGNIQCSVTNSHSYKSNTLTPINPYSKSIWQNEQEFRSDAIRIEKLRSKVTEYSPKNPTSQTKSLARALSEQPKNTEFESPEGPVNLAPRISAFFDSFFHILKNEEEFSYTTDALNMVYRQELYNNRRFRDKLMSKNSNDEIMLFGNIDTISQLSSILAKTLKNYIRTCCKSGTDRILWEGHDNTISVPQEFVDVFDPTDFLESHLNKIKSTYSAYFSTHNRQLQLLAKLKFNRQSLFYKWYEICLEKSGHLRIEDIIEAPINRSLDFQNELEIMISRAMNYLPGKTIIKLKSFQGRYALFLKEAKRLLDVAPSASIRASLCPNSHQIEARLLVPASIPSSRSSDTHFSLSSSRYSDRSNAEFSSQAEKTLDTNVEQTLHTDAEKYPTPDEGLTLAELMERFKRVKKLLSILEKEVRKFDLTAVLDKNLKQAEEWRKIFEFEPPSPLLTEHKNVESIYSAYVNKIHQQRQEVMLMKLTDIQTHTLDPLCRMLELCKPVESKIQDLRSLKKDYIGFLKSKEERNVRVEVIIQHFKSLQDQLLRELPLFLEIVSKVTYSILIAYNRNMMSYMEILGGGRRLLQRELGLIDTGERDAGDNFDILQLFSSSRFYAKRLIRENWNCHGKAEESRVVRKLFEM